MRHTFKCQLPATANGFLLPARSALSPLPFSRSFSLLLSITRSFFFVLFSICHTHHATPLPFPTPCNCSTIFFLETCVNYRRKEEEEGGGQKRECGRIVCVCLCVRGHPPRLSRDLHRNVHTFFWLLPPPMPPSGCLFLCLFCFLASSVTNFDACLIRYATISFSFAMLSSFPPLLSLFPLSLPLL